MILLSNTTAQLLQPGQSITFDKVILHHGCGECHNEQLPKTVKLRKQGVYTLHFSANITSATAGDALQLAIAAGGQPLVETAMNTTPSTANALRNVSTGTYFENCCSDMNRLSVINTGATAVTVAPNTSFMIEHNGCNCN